MTHETFASMQTAADEAPELLPASGYSVALTLEVYATGERRWGATLWTHAGVRRLAATHGHETPEAAAWALVEDARRQVDARGGLAYSVQGAHPPRERDAPGMARTLLGVAHERLSHDDAPPRGGVLQ